MSKAAISLTTGLEDAEKVTVAFLVAVGAAEGGRDTLIFLTKEAVRLAIGGFARATACANAAELKNVRRIRNKPNTNPPLTELMARFADAGGRYIACGVCVQAKGIDASTLVANAEVAGTVQLWEWIGDGATTFSF